ncbi:MAG: metallopeptidase family protein [Alphaproteobacteria bacterium]|nr:metallopeptidase family protein [Alphaproteobacteria bacterium]
MIRSEYTTPPSLADLEAIALEERDRLPEPVRAMVRDVPVMIEDFCDDEVADELGLESPWDLSGLYSGTAEPDKGSGHVAHDHDRIFLYRRPLLDEWVETGVELRVLIRHVLIHEIGHHFGFSDADMAEIERRSG